MWCIHSDCDLVTFILTNCLSYVVHQWMQTPECMHCLFFLSSSWFVVPAAPFLTAVQHEYRSSINRGYGWDWNESFFTPPPNPMFTLINTNGYSPKTDQKKQIWTDTLNRTLHIHCQIGESFDKYTVPPRKLEYPGCVKGCVKTWTNTFIDISHFVTFEQYASCMHHFNLLTFYVRHIRNLHSQIANDES